MIAIRGGGGIGGHERLWIRVEKFKMKNVSRIRGNDEARVVNHRSETHD